MPGSHKKLCGCCGEYATALAYEGSQWLNPDGSHIQLLLCDRCDRAKCPNCKQALHPKVGVCSKCLTNIPKLTTVNLTIPDTA